MGILDDAIREHLELKRQHGVPDEELRRQEEEALGPARREVVPAADADGEPEPAAADEEPSSDEETAFDEDEALGADEALGELDEQEPVDSLRGLDEHGARDEDAAVSPEPEPDAHDLETALYESEDEPAPVDPADDRGAEGDEGESRQTTPQEGEDVLEDTPDFLQETPEHDRLWFEQKPPRDFDFD